MLSIIKKKGKDDSITRIIWQTQHCYGGEGGYIDYEGNFDEEVLISYFFPVWHIVLHRIVPFLCTHYSKRTNQNNVYYPFLKDLMGNDVTDVSCTSSRIHGKFHTMTSSRDVIKNNGFNMKILKITTISEQKKLLGCTTARKMFTNGIILIWLWTNISVKTVSLWIFANFFHFTYFGHHFWWKIVILAPFFDIISQEQPEILP